MKKISVILGVLLAVLAHPAMADESHAQIIARACAGDLVEFCGGEVPLSSAASLHSKDLLRGGILYNCLLGHIATGRPGQSLSESCWRVMMDSHRWSD
jgi:hypothetical protein